MYEIIKNVILSDVFELSEMLNKIEVVWIKSEITDEEKEELIQLAREHADPIFSLNLQMQIDNIVNQLKDIENRLSKLEQGSGVQPEEYPEFVVGKVYKNGDKVTFDGNKYVCIAPEGQICVWSPADYPTYWKSAE